MIGSRLNQGKMTFSVVSQKSNRASPLNMIELTCQRLFASFLSLRKEKERNLSCFFNKFDRINISKLRIPQKLVNAKHELDTTEI